MELESGGGKQALFRATQSLIEEVAHNSFKLQTSNFDFVGARCIGG